VADIFQEVNEEVRRDRAVELWKKYGTYVAGAALAIVLATAGWVGWKEYQVRQQRADGARFAAALELVRQGQTEEGSAALDRLAAEAGAGYRTLARFQLAAARAAAGDKAGAVSAYDEIIADGGADPALRDLATLLAALIEIDSAPADVVERRLAGLADGFGPWRPFARELQAAAMLGAGDREGARKVFAELTDDATAPAGVRARAAEMLAALGGAS